MKRNVYIDLPRNFSYDKKRVSVLKTNQQIPLIVWIGLVFLAGLFLGYLTVFDGGDFITGAQTSSVGNLTVNIVSNFACTFSNENFNVSFGDSLAQDTKHNASMNFAGYGSDPVGQNITRYNITAATTNSVNVNITIAGCDLFQAGSTWYIGAGNISWNSTTNRTFAAGNGSLGVGNVMVFPGKKNLTNNCATPSYDNEAIAVALPPTAGSNVAYLRYWLQIPSNQLAGTYRGNHTTRCTDAT